MSNRIIGHFSCVMLAAAVSAAGCGSDHPVLVLATSPADAVVAVDGFVHPGPSPHEIVFKQPGSFELSISREGYRAVEMLVTLAAGERREQTVELVAEAGEPRPPVPPPDLPPLVPVDPPLEGFTLRVDATPEGSTVMVREPGAARARSLGATPVEALLPDTGASEVFISRAGYSTVRRMVVAPAGGGEVHLDVTLARQGQGAPEPEPVIQDPPAIIDPLARGYLSVTSTPWSAVSINGRPLGNTPLVRVEIESGTHRLLLENRDQGVRREKTVIIRPGEHVRLVEKLR